MEDVKKTITCALAGAILTRKLKQEKLILVTAAGTIIGDVVLSTGQEGSVQGGEPVNSFWDLFARAYQDKEKLDRSTLGSDGYLLMRNVKLINQGQTMTYESLLVFFDEIIACSIGTLR